MNEVVDNDICHRNGCYAQRNQDDIFFCHTCRILWGLRCARLGWGINLTPERLKDDIEFMGCFQDKYYSKLKEIEEKVIKAYQTKSYKVFCEEIQKIIEEARGEYE